ncbi:MAG: accessory factor UbiK family protein [Oleibacter sp.]|nr:accessory factor UbiK family protein [Thalassolituus sp.]
MKPEGFKQKIDQLLQQTPFAGLSSDLRLAMQSQLHSLVTSANLVSREEFEVQSEVLRRTQARLIDLEMRLTELEKSQS